MKKSKRGKVSHGRLQKQVESIKHLDRKNAFDSNQNRFEHNYRQKLFVMEKMKAIFSLKLNPEIDLEGEIYKPAFMYELAKSDGQRVIGDFLARHPNKEAREALTEKVKRLFGVDVQFVS